MKLIIAALVLFAASMQLVNGMQNLDLKYPFSNYLDDTFKLYWDFDMKQQKIDFAVNVSTNGWIGFGISPTGRMLQSDIVVGWVNSDGTAQFHVSWNTYYCIFCELIDFIPVLFVLIVSLTHLYSHLQDRYANIAHILPPIDASQDCRLVW